MTLLNKTQESLDTKEKKFLIFLFLGALLLRVFYLFEMTDSPYFGAPFLDELYHLTWAREIAAGEWIRHDAFFRAPLYSYLLGIFIRIFGVDFFLIRFIQHIFGASGVIAIYFLARRIFSAREARIAGILAACCAPFFFLEGEMLDISLQFLLYPLILIQALRSLKTPSVKNCLIAGFLIGLSAIARPNILLFVPVLFIFWGYIWRKKRDAPIDLAFRCGVAFIAMLIIILPATIHNYIAGRTFVPIASYGGVNFYIGNNPKADGFTARTARRMFFFGRYEDSVEAFAREEASLQLGRTDLTASAVSRYWSARAMRWILENPRQWALLMLKKTAIFFGNYEIKNNKNIYFVARYSMILRVFLAFLPFALVGSSGLLGLFFAIRKKPSPEVWLLLLFFITYTVSVVLFFVTARYRAPVLTLLIPAAAYCLTTLWDASGGGRHATLFGGMVALLVLVSVSIPDWFHVRPANFSSDHWSVGNCYQEKDNLPLAEKHYRTALTLDPDYDDALNNLGEVLYKKGDYGSALETFKDLLRRHPDYVAGWNNVGVCYEDLSIFGKAEEAYRTALMLYPAHIRARLNLAEVLLKQGRADEAHREYDTALNTAPLELRPAILSDKRFSAFPKP